MAVTTPALLLVLLAALAAGAPPPPIPDEPGAFWFGTQDLGCLKHKGALKVRRSAGPAAARAARAAASPPGANTDGHLEALERSTVQYVHRLVYYRGQVWEWGAGTRGYHFGPTPSITDCPVVWEAALAGNSSCPSDVLVAYTEGYRARYGGYNMVTNNCHHYANRVGMILISDDCRIGEDKWAKFNKKFWRFIRSFMAVFNPGSLEHDTSQHQGNPHNAQDWPIVQWY